MSKKHGHRKKRRKKKARTTPELLAAVAWALEACERAGLPVYPAGGIIRSREGYVVQFSDGSWRARNLVWTEFSPADDSDDD